MRSFLGALILLNIVTGMDRTRASGLLYVEKMFGWNVVQFTTYQSFFTVTFLFRMFITTPLLCYYLRMHDVMLAITGALGTLAQDVTLVSR